MLYQKEDELKKIRNSHITSNSFLVIPFKEGANLESFLDRYLKEVLVC